MSRLKLRPAPDLEHREAASFFSGWWCGISVGSVIGIGLATLFFTSGVLS